MAAHGHSDDGTDFAHPMPLPVLFGVFFALVILTIITVAQASLDLGSFDIAVVMGIATVKACLVAGIFMHLIYDKPFNIIVFLSSFVFVGLFVIFTLSDSKMTSPSFEPKIDEPAASAEM
ncbi:cytochrome c oxidase subunit 4 [Rhodopirellula rubra]|uniref:Cytochrome c oxidase subunit 4 n=1 Tax=Aporhodopirellula rubra TaxID=980271 RepID=A0A7W5DV56_9BACT|nr:cytochrome C oxidase subunit IV family protein [Aporhodopirellula rubra]MBB3205125.1 cytochrome c oxidase subunit 4 [Aporhodopirellula rubra]